MSWQTFVNALAIVGAICLLFSGAVVVVGLLLTKNADAFNRHSTR